MELAKESKPYIARGMIAGLITIPLGCFLGGMAAGFPVSLVLHDLLPVAIVSLILIIGMLRFRDAMVRGFIWLGRFIQAVATAGLLLGILQSLTGFTPVKGIAPVSEALGVVATVAIFLAGAFPFMHVLTKLLQKPLRAAGKRIGINEVSAIGPLLTLVNSIPMLETMKDMDERGKVLNAAFCVTGAFMFRDFFGYVGAVNPSMLLPMTIAKLSSGIVAMVVSLWMSKGK